MTVACAGPTPNTVCVPSVQSGHARHPNAAFRTADRGPAGISGAAVSRAGRDRVAMHHQGATRMPPGLASLIKFGQYREVLRHLERLQNDGKVAQFVACRVERMGSYSAK